MSINYSISDMIYEIYKYDLWNPICLVNNVPFVV